MKDVTSKSHTSNLCQKGRIDGKAAGEIDNSCHSGLDATVAPGGRYVMRRVVTSGISCIRGPDRKATSIGASLLVLSAALAQPARAQSTNPNPPPTAPSSVTFGQTSTLGAAQCAQQYTSAINTANDVGLAANAVGAAAQVVALTAQEVAATAKAAEFAAMAPLLAVDIPLVGSATGAAVPAGALAVTTGVEAIALGAGIVGAASTVTGVASQIAATTFVNAAASLPNCDATYIGTQTINVPAGQGALNVNGVSYFNGNVGVTQNVDVGGNVTASKLIATQGISADGEHRIGNPDLTTFATGINIGGAPSRAPAWAAARRPPGTSRRSLSATAPVPARPARRPSAPVRKR